MTPTPIAAAVRNTNLARLVAGLQAQVAELTREKALLGLALDERDREVEMLRHRLAAAQEKARLLLDRACPEAASEH